MKTCLTFLLIILAFCASAQQDPLYGQYLLNPLIINPAYAGLNNNFNALVGYRAQWTSFEGQPNTLNASVHSSFLENKLGGGLTIMNDRVGISANTEVNLVGSYKLLMNDYTISFGMQAGIQQFRTSYNTLTIFDRNDIAFVEGLRESRLNVGAGVAYKSDNLQFGFSVPRMLPTTFKNGGQDFQLYQQHYYFTTAYLHPLNENIWLKPSILARAVKGSPFSVDGSLNAVLKSGHMAGIFTRNLNTYGALLQALINDRFFIGYIFEIPTNRSVGVNFISHEFNLAVRLSARSFHDRTISNF